MAAFSQSTAGQLTKKLYPKKPKKFKTNLGQALAKGKTNGSGGSRKCS